MNETGIPRPKDADLRRIAHAHGARPGTKLWAVLVELQRRRDGDRSESSQRRAVR